MNRTTTRRWIAVAAFVSPLYLFLEGWVALVAPVTVHQSLLWTTIGVDGVQRISDSAGLSATLTALGFVGIVGLTASRYGLWWLDRRGPGSVLLLAAALIGTLPLITQAISPWFMHYVAEWSPAFLVRVDHFVGLRGWLVLPLSQLFLGAGLIRSRTVPTWVGVFALLATVLMVASTPIPENLGPGSITWGAGDLQMATFVPFLLAQSAFSIALGIALLKPAPEVRTRAVEQAHRADGAR